MRNKNKIGHAFSDHVYEEKVKRKKSFSYQTSGGFFRFIPLFLLLFFVALLILRLFTLDVVRAAYYSRLSNDNRIRSVIVPAPRGIIFDRNGNALTRNIPSSSILEDKKVVFLDNDTALKDLTNGKNVISTVKRDYPYKDIFAHVVGYVGQVSQDELLLPPYKDYGFSDFTGRMGLEQQYESLLHGENGRELYEVNAKGERVRLLGQEDPKQGAVLRTTLDVNIQESVAKAMKNVDKGAVVVSDPRNGAILALFSKPTFDPNLFTQGASYKPEGDYKSIKSIIVDNTKFPLLDRAIAGIYPPGSTFKIVTSIAALSSHSITEDTEFDDTGTITVGGTTFGTWEYLEDGKKLGNINIETAIQKSNDIFFYDAAMKTGVDSFNKWARIIGMGEKTGIDLPGELAGVIPSPSWKEKMIGEPWYLGDTVNMGIGQGYVEVTPLQVNMYTQLIANGGEIFKPHLILGNIDLEKKDFISPAFLGIIKSGMEEACQPGGTGYPLFNYAVKNSHLKPDGLDYVADASAGAGMVHITNGCKTGTSEDGYHSSSNPHAWFTIFAPFYNPEIAVTVLIENGGQGSDVAAPIAKQILTSYFERK